MTSPVSFFFRVFFFRVAAFFATGFPSVESRLKFAEVRAKILRFYKRLGNLTARHFNLYIRIGSSSARLRISLGFKKKGPSSA